MSDFLRTGKYPQDPRELLAQITATYPGDRERALRVWIAAVHDRQPYLRACIEHAFETWSTLPQQ